MLLEHGVTVIEDEEYRTALQVPLIRREQDFMKLLSDPWVVSFITSLPSPPSPFPF